MRSKRCVQGFPSGLGTPSGKKVQWRDQERGRSPSSKKGYLEPDNMPSPEPSPCWQRDTWEGWLRISARISLRKSLSHAAVVICLALAVCQLAATTCIQMPL